MKRLFLAVAFATMTLSLLAQPNIGLRPDRTVFFYAKDAKAAAKAVADDPVIAKKVETMAAAMQHPTTPRGAESIDQSGSMTNVAEYARMDIYQPKNPNGQMVIVCPGGAYALIATYNEGIYPADWLVKQGVTVGVLKYRMPNGTWDAPLEDVHNAFRYARSHGDELGVKKVGIMGFSAGGHLAASGVVLYDDPVTRPDFGILVYPVISMDAAITHGGTRSALLGNDAAWNDRAAYPMDEYLARQAQRDALVEKFSCEKQVTPDTPPVFITLCYDDMVVPPQNSLRFYEACLQNKVTAEMHIFPKGVHGWGFNLKEYNMNDNMEYCRAELLNSLSRWLGGLEEMEAAKKAAAQRGGMRGGMPGGMPGGAPGGPRP